MISHVRFDLQVMPTSQHLWLGNNLPGRVLCSACTFVFHAFFVLFFLFLFVSLRTLTFYFTHTLFLFVFMPCSVHRSVFMFLSALCSFCLLDIFVPYTLWCAVFFWSVGLAILHVIKCIKYTKKHKNPVVGLRKNKKKQAFKTNLYIVGWYLLVWQHINRTIQPDNNSNS